MAFPIVKLLMVTFRIASRPLNNLIVRTIKSRGLESKWRHGFISMGQKFYVWEIKINRFIVNDDNKNKNKNDPADIKEDEKKVYIKPLSDDGAFNKGVEYFSEIFFFYGILMALAIYEIRKGH